MSNIQDRVVAFRVARDPDKDDEDDDSSSSSVSATTTPTTQPKPPGPLGPLRPGTDTSTLSTTTRSPSLATITQSSTGFPDPTAASIQAPARSAEHFSPAASAGIGVGAAVAVLLLALAAWLFVRRRRSSRIRKTSVISTADTDFGNGESDLKGYGPSGMKELEAGRRASELAAHMEPVEVVGDPDFVAELQGSDTPVAGWRKPDRERLFADAPINDEGDHDENVFSKFDGEKQVPGDYKESYLSKMGDEKRNLDDHEKSDLSKMDVKKKDS